jgi:hypothetical protein
MESDVVIAESLLREAAALFPTGSGSTEFAAVQTLKALLKVSDDDARGLKSLGVTSSRERRGIPFPHKPSAHKHLYPNVKISNSASAAAQSRRCPRALGLKITFGNGCAQSRCACARVRYVP